MKLESIGFFPVVVAKNIFGIELLKAGLMVRNKQDSAWKDVLEAFFKDFLDYCLPELSELIDWSKGWLLLDKEMQTITNQSISGKRLLDKLFRVFLKTGEEKWILIHIEIQGDPDIDFPNRMLIYGYRIYDKYQKPVVSCAILTDSSKNWRPDHFEIGMAGSYLRLEYVVIKLIDYESKREELELSQNPFACVILAQLDALKIHAKPHEQRKSVKFALTKRLYEKGYNKNEISNLYKFIDWLIGLPEPLEVEYLNEVHQLEEKTKMAYVTFAEQYGIEKGIKIGIEQGNEQGFERGVLFVAANLLKEGQKPIDIKKVTGLSLNEIRDLELRLAKSHWPITAKN